jgi:hypothetical protein
LEFVFCVIGFFYQGRPICAQKWLKIDSKFCPKDRYFWENLGWTPLPYTIGELEKTDFVPAECPPATQLEFNMTLTEMAIFKNTIEKGTNLTKRRHVKLPFVSLSICPCFINEQNGEFWFDMNVWLFYRFDRILIKKIYKFQHPNWNPFITPQIHIRFFLNKKLFFLCIITLNRKVLFEKFLPVLDYLLNAEWNKFYVSIFGSCCWIL